MSTPARPALPPGVYALCDDTLRPELDVVEKARLLLEGGVKVMQLRMKRTTGRAAIAAAKSVAELCRARGALCIVNDRADWALVARADGVHVGEDDLTVADARRVLGSSLLLGATCRNAADVARAKSEGADHAGLGPVFSTSTKTVPAKPIGPAGLAEVVSESVLPLVAIAGITLDNIEAVARAGAHCAAVGSDLYRTDDIPARVRALSEAFARGRVSA